jgi:hypothetical protein
MRDDQGAEGVFGGDVADAVDHVGVAFRAERRGLFSLVRSFTLSPHKREEGANEPRCAVEESLFD